MFLSVECSEDMPRIVPAEIAAETRGRFLGTAFFDTRLKPCAFWPRGAVNPDFYQPVASDKPVLIFFGADDPIMPPVWGDEAARSLKKCGAPRRARRPPRRDHARLRPELVEKFLRQLLWICERSFAAARRPIE